MRTARAATAHTTWAPVREAEAAGVVGAQTKPVVDYYSKQGLYAPVDANQKSDTVKAAIAAILA